MRSAAPIDPARKMGRVLVVFRPREICAAHLTSNKRWLNPKTTSGAARNSKQQTSATFRPIDIVTKVSYPPHDAAP
jgi:hypothetical protein